MTDRPFKLLGVQQIAIGGLDLATLRRLWIDTLGLKPTINFRNDTENVYGEIARVGLWPFQVDLNLLQPIVPEKSPRPHKPPLNHIGFWVDNLTAAAGWLSAQGIGFTPRGIRKGAAGHDVCFIHPTMGGQGVLIELIQAPPELIELYRRIASEPSPSDEGEP